MERDKMLEKLHSIKAISTNIVATYDMGLQFDVMTGEGVTTNIGNVGSWPYLKIPITEGIKAIKERIVNGEDKVSDDIRKEEIFKELLTYCNMCTGDTRMVEDRIIEKCVTNLKKELLKIDENNDYCYCYIDLEDWSDGEVILFKCYNDMCKHFVGNFGSSVNLYDDMDDDELECAYTEAEENEWDGICFRDLTAK